MSGNSYTVTCSEFNGSWDLEIYDDELSGLKLDCSEVVCLACDKKEHPENWFDHQCDECNRWFNTRANDRGGINLRSGPICNPCINKIAAHHRTLG